jgi:hypothetical protein
LTTDDERIVFAETLSLTKPKGLAKRWPNLTAGAPRRERKAAWLSFPFSFCELFLLGKQKKKRIGSIKICD